MLLYSLTTETSFIQETKFFFFAIASNIRIYQKCNSPFKNQEIPFRDYHSFLRLHSNGFFALNMNKGTLKLCRNAMRSHKFKRMSEWQSRENFHFRYNVYLKFDTKNRHTSQVLSRHLDTLTGCRNSVSILRHFAIRRRQYS